jgi:hypothetical protein
MGEGMNQLVPFQKTSAAENFKIEASIVRKSAFEVHMEFHLEGKIESLLCPSPEDPTRQDNLWQSTCFEGFLNQKNGGYLEINCSPSGHWNAYEFDSYRQNMRPAHHITVRLTRLEKDDKEARFFIQVISEKELALTHAGLTVVLETKSHEKSHWALRHPAEQADFHHADGWTVSMTPATR